MARYENLTQITNFIKVNFGYDDNNNLDDITDFESID